MPHSPDELRSSPHLVTLLPPDDGAVLSRQRFHDSAQRVRAQIDEKLEKMIATIKAAPKGAWDFVMPLEDDLVRTQEDQEKLRQCAYYFVYLVLISHETLQSPEKIP